MNQPTKIGINIALLASFVLLPTTQALADEPFQLHAEERGFVAPPTESEYPEYPKYPAYPTLPATPRLVPAKPVKAVPPKPLKSSAAVTATPAPTPPPKAPVQGAVQQSIALPPGFLGVWRVMGQRSKVEGRTPEFQQGAEQAFSMSNDQLWQISGSPETGYGLASNTGIRTQISVDKVSGNTAYLRYQHQVKNTMAQEVVVMSINGPGSFQGLERITIVKPGEPPRCRVTYQLIGQKQR